MKPIPLETLRAAVRPEVMDLLTPPVRVEREYSTRDVQLKECFVKVSDAAVLIGQQLMSREKYQFSNDH